MSTWGLFVPTYRRKEPLILQMLDKDPELVINLCVRHEEIESGFYDELSKKERVKIIDLGSGLQELGETRERILDYCYAHYIRYCFMFDDGMFDVNDATDESLTISQVFEKCIDILIHDELSEYAIGMTFTKRKYLDPYTGIVRTKRNRQLSDDEHYFLVHAGQAVLINVDLAFRRGIHYQNMNVCGFEDAAFQGDAIKAGLVFCSRKSITVDGVIPNIPKPGGSHHDDFDLEKKYDSHNARCCKYLNMMGISIQKRYYDYCKRVVSFIIWDFDYFRQVLVKQRDKNGKILRSHFAIPEDDK